MSGGLLSGRGKGGEPKTNPVAKTFIYKCGLENQVRRNPLGMVSVTWSAWGMWTGWSRLSPVERSWCRVLYLLVLGGPASLRTVPVKERTGESGKAGFGRTGVGSGKGAEGLGVCRGQTAEVRGTEGWFGFRIEKRVQDRSCCRKRTRDGNDLCRLCALLLLPRWGCARRSTRGCCGGGAVLSAESGYCRPEGTRVPVEAVGSALIFCPGSEKERNFSATGSIS
jgi:hypothetical protein